MPNPILVPVVAHRMYGRRYVVTGATTSGGSTPGGPFGFGVPTGPTLITEEVVDRSHGTRRGVEEIERLFHEGSDPGYTRGASVNGIWRDSAVQFVLCGVVDQMVDSHLADFLPGWTARWPDLASMRYGNALNMFFFRDLEGAWGFYKDDVIAIADRWSEGRGWRREDVWLREVVTVAHEIGHAFDLGHRGARDNVMYGWGTGPATRELTPAQAVFSQQRARVYRRPWYRAIPDDDEVRAAPIHVPHVAGHAGERLPTFD